MPGEHLISFGFGVVEHLLARSSGIASHRRTQFQARLRNFQRLGIPRGVSAGKGRAATYGPGEIAQLALAIELTELGLPPERVAVVMGEGVYPLLMAVRFAASNLATRPTGFDGEGEDGPPCTFLHCDPSALSPLKDGYGEDEDTASQTFFYVGGVDLQHNLVKWTSGQTPRLAVINVTALLRNIGRLLGEMHGAARNMPEVEARGVFYRELADWADQEVAASEAAALFKERASFDGAAVLEFIIQQFTSGNYEIPRNSEEASALLPMILRDHPGLPREPLSRELQAAAHYRANRERLPAGAEHAESVAVSAGDLRGTLAVLHQHKDILEVGRGLSDDAADALEALFQADGEVSATVGDELLWEGAVAVPESGESRFDLTPFGWALAQAFWEARDDNRRARDGEGWIRREWRHFRRILHGNG